MFAHLTFGQFFRMSEEFFRDRCTLGV